MNKKIAVYPGTFDPITYGHMDIIKRAAKLFYSVIVAVGEDPQKAPVFTLSERFDMIKNVIESERFENVSVDRFRGLLVHYLEKVGSIIIIRGLRAVTDFEHEFQMALANRKLHSIAETVFLLPGEQFVYLSSSMVKTIALNNGDVSPFVPPFVEKFLYSKLRRS